jgi:phosphatidylserine/phosphatidylglycerophosphate/cardiolipin synthase-like enzyme
VRCKWSPREPARALPQNVLADLVAGGVGVWLDGNFQAAHNKVIVIDADAPHATTITGRYNFTIAAQRSNAENVVVLRDNPAVARVPRQLVAAQGRRDAVGRPFASISIVKARIHSRAAAILRCAKIDRCLRR